MAAPQPGGGAGQQSTLITNASPSTISFKKTILLSTLDQNNNNASVTESSYVVSGPVAQGVTPIYLNGGQKAVIPLTSQTGNGAPYLKIHFPTNGSTNAVYVTYCVANQYMADGFYDYKTGVPTTYFNALRSWINTNPVSGTQYLNGAPTLRTRQLKFSTYGASTNKPSNAITFYIKFQGTFGNGNILIEAEEVGFGAG